MSLLRNALLFLSALVMGHAAMAQVQPRDISIADAGIAARYYAPAVTDPSRAAVLMVGGSDGGYPSRKAALDLANAGHPVLALAYFSGFAGKIDGLPERLERIPVEYAYRGLSWLHAELGRERPVVIMGESRGAELALLVASRRPDVAGVVAFSPSSVAWPAAGDTSGKIPAWTEDGLPLPYIDLPVAKPELQFSDGLADRERASRAAIPIERSNSAVLLISSRSDNIWPAAQMADQLAERLRAAHFRKPVTNLEFDDASHLLMGPGAGVVRFTQGTFSIHFGGSEEGTLAARTAAWKAAKRFLLGLSAPVRRTGE
jgi:dienelactone hydrolase